MVKNRLKVNITVIFYILINKPTLKILCDIHVSKKRNLERKYMLPKIQKMARKFDENMKDLEIIEIIKIYRLIID